MRKSIKIGDKEYKSKKDALSYYKNILNSYDFDEILNDDDFDDLLDLIIYDEEFDEMNSNENPVQALEVNTESKNAIIEDNEEEEEIFIQNIKIGRSQFNTKCFELVYNDLTTEYISYLIIMNRPKIDYGKLFHNASRNAIHKDIIALKQQYFKDNTQGKGYVKCQESGELCKWNDLVVDHRQPNTLSIIQDRFKELNSLNVTQIEYIIDDKNLLVFKDSNLAEKFRIYHKEKANLRVVKKELNSSRASMGRVKQSGKDLKIK